MKSESRNFSLAFTWLVHYFSISRYKMIYSVLIMTNARGEKENKSTKRESEREKEKVTLWREREREKDNNLGNLTVEK